MAEQDSLVASTARFMNGQLKSKTADALENAGHEIKVNPPKILARTKSKFGAARAERQRRAILLSKARSAGAKIPKLST